MTTEPFLPTPEDARLARIQLDQLQEQDRLSTLMADLLSALAQGKAVQLVTLDREIGTQQAAELLNVSRPYVVKLVEQGAIPHRKVGPRRRLHLDDVLAYRVRLEQQRADALQALADELQDLGLA